jgi:hypothetical protein
MNETMDDLINSANEENREALLDSIAFDLYELKFYRSLYHKHSFDDLSNNFSSIIINLKKDLQKLKDDYEQRYGKKPDLKDAWRIFIRNRANAKQSGRESRIISDLDSEFKLEDMGI